MILQEINTAQLFIQILQFTIPALVVFAVTYFTLKRHTDEEFKRRQLEIKASMAGDLTPTKLEAYERLTILMERIKPDNLVLRNANSGLKATEFRHLMLQQINDEFSHNVSQQLYVSDQAWKLICAVKENLINNINEAYADLKEDARGIDLGKAFLNLIVERNDQSTQQAIQFLKKEIDIVFSI